MSRVAMSALGVMLLLTLGGCPSNGTGGGPRIDSNTNWLMACSETADCASDLACICGQCTATCQSDGACASLGAGRCVDGAAPFCPSSAAPICLPTCATDAECGPRYGCSADGVCLPEWSLEIDTQPGADTGDADTTDTSPADVDTPDASVDVVVDTTPDVTPDTEPSPTRPPTPTPTAPARKASAFAAR